MVTITSFWSSRVMAWGAAPTKFVLQSRSAKARALVRLHMGLSSTCLVGCFWRVRPGRSGEVPGGSLRNQLSSRLASARRRPSPRINSALGSRRRGAAPRLEQRAPSQLEMLFRDADGDAELGGLRRQDRGMRLGAPDAQSRETAGE